MSIIDNALEDIFNIDRPVPEPRPLRIPDVEPALQEHRTVIVSPAAYEIIRRAYESLP